MSGNELARLQRERDSLERCIGNIDDKVTVWSRERERHAGQLKVVQAKIDVQKRARKAGETTTSLRSVSSFHRMKANRSACSPDRR
jgi:hypothetical protein